MPESSIDRRRVLKVLSAAGIGSAVFGRALHAVAADAPKITEDMIRQASWIAGVPINDEQRTMMLEGAQRSRRGLRQAAGDPHRQRGARRRSRSIRPRTASAPRRRRPARRTKASAATAHPPHPGSKEDVAFAPVTLLSEWLRRKTISSTELTKLYLERIERLDPKLHAVITLTPERAMKAAAAGRRGDREGAPAGPAPRHSLRREGPAGGGRLQDDVGLGPVQGPGARRDGDGRREARRRRSGPASRRRRSASWPGGTSGSTACAATRGSSTRDRAARRPARRPSSRPGASRSRSARRRGGASSRPATRCGVTGLRPTFGRVSRHGAMALSWTMDKIGPIARSGGGLRAGVRGDPRGGRARPVLADRAVRVAGRARRVKSIRVGYVKSLFEADYTKMADKDEDKRRYEEWKAFDARSLDTLRSIGFELKPIELDDLGAGQSARRRFSPPRPRARSTRCCATAASTRWCARSTTPGRTFSARARWCPRSSTCARNVSGRS